MTYDLHKEGEMVKNLSHKITLMEHGVTQRQVAQMLHYSESYVSMLISGERKSVRFDKFIEFLSNLDDEEEVIG